jgi:hypothetical protein
MNTPAYFAMDDFNSENPTTASLGASILNEVLVYPNPAVNALKIDLSNVKDLVASVEILDASGTLVHSISLPGSQVLNIAVEDLPNGFYAVVIKSKNETRHFKLIKAN